MAVDVLTLGALAAAVVFVLAVVYFLQKQKKETPRGAYVSDFELSLSLAKKKDKKPAAPKAEKSPAVPVVSRRMKGVEGAHDDSDEQMLEFLNQKITLETKRGVDPSKRSTDSSSSSSVDEDRPKPKKDKASKQPAEAVEKGYTAVVDRKKPAKDKEEEKEEPEKPVEKTASAVSKKPFYRSEQPEVKPGEPAPRNQRTGPRKEGDRPPRPPRAENGGNGNLPPRMRKDANGAGATAEGATASAEGSADGAPRERKPRPEGAPPRPKREVAPVAPSVTEPFEEWSIDSMLDSITNSAPEPKKKNKQVTGDATES